MVTERHTDRCTTKRCTRIEAYLGNGNVEVESEAQDCAGKKHDENAKGSILKVGHLDFHATELDPPTNLPARRRWLEAHRLPVCTLNVLEVIRRHFVVLINHLRKDYERVTDK